MSKDVGERKSHESGGGSAASGHRFALDQERLPDIRCRICHQDAARCDIDRLTSVLDEIASCADDFPGSEPMLRVRDMAMEALYDDRS